MTRDPQSLSLLTKLMVLHRQILFSLTIAAIAEAILMPASAEQIAIFAQGCSWLLEVVHLLHLQLDLQLIYYR